MRSFCIHFGHIERRPPADTPNPEEGNRSAGQPGSSRLSEGDPLMWRLQRSQLDSQKRFSGVLRGVN